MLKGGYKAGIISANLEISALAKKLDCTVDELLFQLVINRGFETCEISAMGFHRYGLGSV